MYSAPDWPSSPECRRAAAVRGAIASSFVPAGCAPVPAALSDASTAPRTAAARRHSGLDGQSGGEYIVFIKHGKTYAPRRVRAGITDLDYTEITFGLKQDESVMILPSASLARAQQEFKDRMNRMVRMPGAPRSGR